MGKIVCLFSPWVNILETPQRTLYLKLTQVSKYVGGTQTEVLECLKETIEKASIEYHDYCTVNLSLAGDDFAVLIKVASVITEILNALTYKLIEELDKQCRKWEQLFEFFVAF